MISHLLGTLLQLLQLDHIISYSGQQFIERINLGVATFDFFIYLYMKPYRAKLDVASIKLLHALDYAQAQVSCPRKEGMHLEGVRSFLGLAIHLDPLTLKSREPLKDKSTIFTEFALTGLSSVVSSSRPAILLPA